jgi:cob(I)alamin adenosyltransferase
MPNKNQTEDLAPRIYKGPTKRKQKGLLVIYTGNGKGKSTAAFGAIFRSLGRGLRVAVVQFIKGKWISGEIKALEKFGAQVEYYSEGDGFTWDTKNLEKDLATAQRGWQRCLKLLTENNHQVYLFDELIYVLKYNFLELGEVLKGLKLRDSKAHVILTGRDAPPALIEIADLVTEMTEIKHPFHQGILAQPGIDY